ncbi:hypothetical protein MOOR_27870 [Moorella thermoacetica]|uniref:Uncharacterized protein n=1 Tax=Neomoorella thermoacetica TaxID=1525 RepID=A0A1J5JDK7_NEOTH|nr:hypothetical protein MOOR_27870 [Moorella thermoacetica]
MRFILIIPRSVIKKTRRKRIKITARNHGLLPIGGMSLANRRAFLLTSQLTGRKRVLRGQSQPQ